MSDLNLIFFLLLLLAGLVTVLIWQIHEEHDTRVQEVPVRRVPVERRALRTSIAVHRRQAVPVSFHNVPETGSCPVRSIQMDFLKQDSPEDCTESAQEGECA